jgi:hypothetical protein
MGQFLLSDTERELMDRWAHQKGCLWHPSFAKRRQRQEGKGQKAKARRQRQDGEGQKIKARRSRPEGKVQKAKSRR